MNQMLKKLQKMQKDMLQAQKDLEETVFTGTAGGVVSVEIKGDKQVVSLKIDPEALNPEDAELIQDMVVAAINQAMTEIDKKTQEVMAPYTQGIPGLPF